MCKYGSRSNFSTGTIALVNSVDYYSDFGYYIYGLTKVTIDSAYTQGGAKGDSGGPVYVGHKLYGIYNSDDSVETNGSITQWASYFWYSPIHGVNTNVFTVQTN